MGTTPAGNERRRLIGILRPADRAELGLTASIFAVLMFWLIIGLVVAGVVLRTPKALIGIGIALALLLVSSYLVLRRDRFHFWFLAALVASVVISGALSAVALFFAADVGAIIDRLDGPGGSREDALQLVGRISQWAFIWIAAFLPAGLYFLFDRVKLGTLRETFERDILRFDPTVETLSDVQARYGAAMSEAFTPDRSLGWQGRRLVPDRDRCAVLPGLPDNGRTSHGQARALYRQVPVLLATVLITLGWTLAVLNSDSLPADHTGEPDYILALLQPHGSPVVFAFLGAYTFTLLALFRSYVRSDLRPKSYMHAAVRIVIAMVFAWVLAALFQELPTDLTTDGSAGLLVTSFIVGFVPETLLVRLQELARTFAKSRVDGFVERQPLTKLVGIDIYDRARLLEEGVGNIEGLAHHDLPELMLQTRIPVGRIVDWADQAILYLHVVALDEASQGEPAEEGNRPVESERHLRRLQGYGINTATDLLCAREKLGGSPAFLRLLDDREDAADGRPRRLDLVVSAIEDEQWVEHLCAWHTYSQESLEFDSAGSPVPQSEESAERPCG